MLPVFCSYFSRVLIKQGNFEACKFKILRCSVYFVVNIFTKADMKVTIDNRCRFTVVFTTAQTVSVVTVFCIRRQPWVLSHQQKLIIL